MATIDSTPFLSIQLQSNHADLVIVAQVSFGPGESPFQARLDCQVLGKDPLRDDFIFAFPTHFFLNGGSAESVRFERDGIPRSLLNEDIIGGDEIIGELTLRIGSSKVVKRTNVVQLQ